MEGTHGSLPPEVNVFPALLIVVYPVIHSFKLVHLLRLLVAEVQIAESQPRPNDAYCTIYTSGHERKELHRRSSWLHVPVDELFHCFSRC